MIFSRTLNVAIVVLGLMAAYGSYKTVKTAETAIRSTCSLSMSYDQNGDPYCPNRGARNVKVAQ